VDERTAPTRAVQKLAARDFSTPLSGGSTTSYGALGKRVSADRQRAR